MTHEDRMIELLEEMVKWMRVTSIPRVKSLLSEILRSPEERIAYQSSDGKPSKEVAKLAGVSFGTITKWWRIWVKAGIAEAVSARGGKRARRIFSLEDFGIEIQLKR